MWASIAIVVIWLAVLFDALFGPDIVSVSAGGSESARVPSAIVIALFAYLATHAVAKYGFGSAGRAGTPSEEDRA
jgi:multisubunit Na+/H+ antiporter MnhF subunit